MKKTGIILGVILLVGISALFLLGQSASKVDYTRVESREIVNSLLAMGTVIPEQKIEIRTSRAETIERVAVAEGEFIKQGQTLFAYDSDLLKLDLKRAQANYQQAQANLAQSKLAINEAQLSLELAKVKKENAAQTTVAPLKEEVEQAKLEVKHSKKDFERAEELYKQEALSKVEFEQQKNRLEVLQSKLNLAQAKLKQAQREKDDRIEEARLEVKRANSRYQRAQKKYQSSKAALSTAQGAYQQAKIKLQRYTIDAPLAAFILNRNIEAGEYVQPGQKVLTLGSKKLLVRISPDEEELALLELGNEGYVSPEAYPERKYKVRVVRKAPQVNEEQGTIDIYLEFINKDDKIVPNMSVSVEIKEDNSKMGLFIPPEYIVSDNEKNYVYVEDDGVAHKKEIKVKSRQTGQWQIEGLAADEVVVTPTNIENDQQIELKR
ncbi:efflux RND transporter periplasmic adaptor subunit [Halanaerobacter jeridensis]|uniref:RND family efflux transporter MFP subunit n=1 Tax=Halanaerobacter jeridensis TaxID=706427 RepID=A0A939BQ01_9FIRM|nr:efflux RND transporter periplasmic adaptor subunit [Halanaerobacter jeridensis]MBM7555774.1 RND family efflux transporter MFP subunit [Halanaerobacter jeridensis]